MLFNRVDYLSCKQLKRKDETPPRLYSCLYHKECHHGFDVFRLVTFKRNLQINCH